MLEQHDIEAIEACVTRPNSVWEGIKSIITAEKYTWYLESLAKVQIKPDIAKRKAKWDAMDADARSKYLETPDYDDDLKKVLQQVATVLGGNDSKKFQIGSYIKNWIDPKTQNMSRHVAFKTAAVFRFTIDETRQLLFTVLEDDEQTDFNPRLPNEMIYAYAIINGIPVYEAQNKGNVVESPQTSVQAMLHEAKLHFLEILFGGENANYFPELIEKTDGYFNILDSANMTKTALFLAAIITSSDLDVLLRNAAEETKESSSKSEEETSQIKRRPKLLPDVSVMQRCYEYVSYDHEDIFCAERVAEPIFKDAQISKDSYIDVFKYVISVLITAQKQVDPKSKGSARRIAIYSDMKKYIEYCIEYVQKQPKNSLLSAMDFLPLLGESELGQYLQSEFTAMIDTVIVKKIVDEWEMHRNKNSRTTSYHGVEAKVGRGQVDYFRFFFNALKVAFHDLRAITARGCPGLWPVYVEMNRILAYPYFDRDGVGMKVWEYDADLVADGDEYRFTVQILLEYLEYAKAMPNPSRFLTGLLTDVHCFEYFNHSIISRGKEKFVADLDDERKLIGRVCKTHAGHTPLFLLQENSTFTQNEDLELFYPYTRFQKQYYAKTSAYSRSDILKLAFWSFLGSRQNYNSKLGPVDFTDYFDGDVARNTCCAVINESNSLDRFLLLCLAHEDPIQFLKKVIAFYKTLPKKESRDFWKMLR